jgi:hypothetical protein
MIIKYAIIVLTVVIISGCIPSAQDVTMRHPTKGQIAKCVGSTAKINKCIDYFREKGYSVKSVTFKDE